MAFSAQPLKSFRAASIAARSGAAAAALRASRLRLRAASTAWRPGPAPAFLFAPAQIAKRSGDWGAEVLAARMAEAWTAFAAWAEGWLTVEHLAGPDAVIEVFRTYLAGRVIPSVGTVCTMAAGD